jgi:perosamine synthetase
LSIAKKYHLNVIWDAAHALGAEYKNKKIGKFPDITCFSFYVTKPITTGEGGMITTDNKKWAERMRILSLHGMNRDAWKRYSQKGSWYYEVIEPGYKYNLTDLAASIGVHQLRKIEKYYQKRKKIAQLYTRAFQAIPFIQPLEELPERKHIWHLYVIKTKNRDNFIEKLKKHGIGTGVHFIPLRIHPAWKGKEKFVVAEEVFRKIISLPIYPKMTIREANYVIKTIKKIL